ncbi:ABHD14 [Acanthosepion pharaonis]|uniref:ABHD14 n=1 Tax=Acanthosepion pharaonis TaxID=158019 RepID=A0A812D435_ACAPH|nr:ABHD14 [Sepia pharaonis]
MNSQAKQVNNMNDAWRFSNLYKKLKMMIGNVVRVNKVAVFSVGSILILAIYLLSTIVSSHSDSQFVAKIPPKRISWKTQEFVDIPEDILVKCKSIKVNDEDILLEYDSKNIIVSTRQTFPLSVSKVDVLLLHGSTFSSKTWEDLVTLQLLAAAGYRAVAVDLPGKGKTVHFPIRDHGEFLEEIIKMLDMNDPVIISPSMSGMYSLPFLMKAAASKQRLCSGFVSIAVVGTVKYKHFEYERIKVPTMLIRGSQDVKLGKIAEENLKYIPTSEQFVLQDAGHAAYMTRTADFHRLLYNFLLSVSSIRAKVLKESGKH